MVLATRRMALDASRGLDGDPNLRRHRSSVARLSPARHGGRMAGSPCRQRPRHLTLPVVVDEDMVDGVVWVPEPGRGFEVPLHLAGGAGIW